MSSFVIVLSAGKGMKRKYIRSELASDFEVIDRHELADFFDSVESASRKLQHLFNVGLSKKQGFKPVHLYKSFNTFFDE